MENLSQNDQRSPEARITSALSRIEEAGAVTSGGEENSFRPLFHPTALSRPVRCSVPTGKEIHRDQKTDTAERRYTSLSPAPTPSRIPRNSAAGDWRWRPRALRDKPTRHHHHHLTAQPTPYEYIVAIVEAQKLSEVRGRRRGKCIKYGYKSPPSVCPPPR